MLYYSEVLRNLTKRECFPAVESYPAVTSQGCKNEAKPQVQKKCCPWMATWSCQSISIDCHVKIPDCKWESTMFMPWYMQRGGKLITLNMLIFFTVQHILWNEIMHFSWTGICSCGNMLAAWLAAEGECPCLSTLYVWCSYKTYSTHTESLALRFAINQTSRRSSNL